MGVNVPKNGRHSEKERALCRGWWGEHIISVLNTLAKPNMFKSVGSHLAEQMLAFNLLFSENNSFPGNHKLFPNPEGFGVLPEGAAIPPLWILVGLAIGEQPRKR